MLVEMRRHWVFALAFLLLLPAVPAEAQTVMGRILDAASGRPIYTADVTVLGTDGSVAGRASTDEAGRFQVKLAGAGGYQVRVERIGYEMIVSDPFELADGQEGVLDTSLQPSAIELDPVEAVVAGGLDPRLVSVGFYKRQEKKWGRFLTREDIEAKSALRATDLVHGIAGLQVVNGRDVNTWDVTMRSGRSSFIRSKGKPCFPAIGVDGFVVRPGGYDDPETFTKEDVEIGRWNDLVPPETIEAMEVYPRSAGLPAWISGYVSPCGAIVIWTKRGRS